MVAQSWSACACQDVPGYASLSLRGVRAIDEGIVMTGVRVDKHGPITVVTIDRPPVRNAVDPAAAWGLAAAFRDFDGDDSSSVAVLTGAGGTFCAGADLRAVADGAAEEMLDPSGTGPMGPTHLLLDKPVIAAVEGHAVAGGLELALWCDLRVAASDATFGVYCRRWGVPLVDGGTVRLPRIVGQGRALDMILTGRAVGAEEAHRWGLVDRWWPQVGRWPPPSPWPRRSRRSRRRACGRTGAAPPPVVPGAGRRPGRRAGRGNRGRAQRRERGRRRAVPGWRRPPRRMTAWSG